MGGADDSASAATADDVADVSRDPVGNGVVSTEIVAILETEPSVTAPRPPSRRTVRGVFREFRCIGSDHYEFVVTDDERTYVFYATSAVAFMIYENGSRVQKDLYCGRQNADVIASYLPKSKSPIGSEVQGELKVLDFVQR